VTFVLKLAITFTTKLILATATPTSTYSMTVKIIPKSHRRATIVARLTSIRATSRVFRWWQLEFLPLLDSNRLSK
jgi:hypothetical protein